MVQTQGLMPTMIPSVRPPPPVSRHFDPKSSILPKYVGIRRLRVYVRRSVHITPHYPPLGVSPRQTIGHPPVPKTAAKINICVLTCVQPVCVH